MNAPFNTKFLVLAFITAAAWWGRGAAAEDDVTYHVVMKDGRRHFAPQYLSAGATTVKWIFPAPAANTVGTLDEHSNGIVFIKFGGYGAEPESKVVVKNFSEKVYGPFNYRFSQNFSDNTVAYCKTRVAVVANVKTGEALHARYGLSMDDYMCGIRFLDPQKNLFAVVKSVDEGKSGWVDYLHIAKLEGEKLVDAGWSMKIGKTPRISPDFPYYNTWLVHDRKLFVHDSGKILCVDGGKAASHPFSEAFNANSGRIGKVKDIAINPKLPFGVIVEESASKARSLTIVRWDAKKKEEQVISLSQNLEPLKSLFGLESMALVYQSFSPDGNWYVVGCVDPYEPKDPHFIAISADRKHPRLLDAGNIVILGQVKNMTSPAWTANPTAYVVSNGELLHKWDLNELPKARVFAAPGGE